MRTTLTLDEDIAAKLRSEMRRSGHGLKQVVNDLLRIALTSRPPTGPKAPPFKVRASAMGLRPGMSVDCVGALLDQLDGPAR